MTYDLYRYIFIGALILCGVMLVVSIILFILLNIPKVISDLSGATAKKAIKNIREQNEATGDKGYQVSALNKARGKLTDKISPSGNIIQQYQSQMTAVGTTKIDTQKIPVENSETTVLPQGSETTVLQQGNETTVLNGVDFNKTVSIADQAENETLPLDAISSVAAQVPVNNATEPFLFDIEYEITYIHTNEIIGTEVMI